MSGFRSDVVQFSNVKYQGKYFVMLGGAGMSWRPNTRAKNKLRLSMKKLLNPKLAKEKIIVIEDSSYREDLEEDEDLNSQQVNSKKEDSFTVKSFSVKNKVVEQSKDSGIKGNRSQKVPVAVADQDEEDDDSVFRKINIPWLSDESLIAKEGLLVDSEVENLQKIVKQYKYQIGFLSETKECLVKPTEG